MTSRTVPLPGLLNRAITDSLSESSDQQLLSRFVESGDEAAFATIVDRHGPMLYGVCRRLLGDSHLADDVLQATFLLLSRRRESIRKRNSVAGWLYRVAQRLARQVRIAEAARSRRERFAVNNRSMEPPRDPGWEELCLVLDEELRRLPERYRIPLLLCYLEGRTQDEAAKQLDWSVRTLRRRLERARILLKARMIRRGATLGAGLFGGILAPSSASAILTPELRRSILASSTGDAKSTVASVAVLRMVAAVTRVDMVTKIATWLAVAAAIVSAAAAAVIQVVGPASNAEQPIALHQPPQTVDQKAQEEAKPAPEPGLDQFHDRLPDKAIARLGTVAFRHGAAAAKPWPGKSLTFTADGKRLVSKGAGWIRCWDVATGSATVNLGDEWPDELLWSSQVTADGKTACICQFRRDDSEVTGVVQDFAQYDLASGAKKQSYPLKFTTMYYYQPVYSPDGKDCSVFGIPGRKMAGGFAIVQWNATDGADVREFKLDPKEFTWRALAYAPDGRSLIACDPQNMIHVYDRTSGKDLRTFGVANKGTNVRQQMAVSADGKLLVTESRGDNFVRLWDLQKGTEKRTFDLPEGAVTESLIFTSDSSTLFVGARINGPGRRFAVYSWNVESGNPGRSWTDDPTIGGILALSPDGQLLATMNSQTGVIQFWDRQTGKEQHSRETNASSLGAVCFRPDGKTILTAGDNDLAIREWDASSGRLHEPPVAKARGLATRFSADGKVLIGKGDKTIWLQDPITGKKLVECEGNEAALSADGKLLATTDNDGRVRLMDVATSKIVADWLTDETETKDGLRPTVRGFSADGKSLVLQGDIVSVWDVQARKRRSSWSLEQNKVLEYFERIEQLAGPKQPKGLNKEKPETVTLSADGSRIAFAVRKPRMVKEPPSAAHRNGWIHERETLRLTTLETETGKVIHQSDFDEPDRRPWQIAFSPDGTILATGARKIQVWDLKTGKGIKQFDGHRAEVTALAFSPDNKRLVSASKDSTALVWDLSK